MSINQHNNQIRPRSKTISVPNRCETKQKYQKNSPFELTPQNTPNTPYFKGKNGPSQSFLPEIALPPSAKVKNTRTFYFLNLM
jgi:hypothetical protein